MLNTNILYAKFDLLIHFKPHLRCINITQIDFGLEKKAHDFGVLFFQNSNFNQPTSRSCVYSLT